MNADIVKYVSENRAKGMSDEAIKQGLLSNGWHEEDLKAYFAQGSTTVALNNSANGNFWNEKIKQKFPSMSLRVGLAFVFIYAAIFVSGDVKVGAKYVPQIIMHFIPLNIFLQLVGAFEVVLSIWLISGRTKLFAGLVAVLFLVPVTLLNLSFFSVTFRNIAIIGAALAYASL